MSDSAEEPLPVPVGAELSTPDRGEHVSTPGTGEHVSTPGAGEYRSSPDPVEQSATPATPARRANFRDRPRGARATGTAASASTTAADTARRTRGLIAAALSIIIVVIIVVALVAQPSGSSSAPVGPTALPAAPIPPFSPSTGSAITVLSTVGTSAALNDPVDAARLTNGNIIIANPGAKNLVLLDSARKVLSTITKGKTSFVDPDAVARFRDGFVVLDASTASLDRFDGAGHFMRSILKNGALGTGRGIAVGPQDMIYIANPLSNSIVKVDPLGTIVKTLHSELGSGDGQFNQPAAVAIGADNTIYVYDNTNQRIEAVTQTGAYVNQWPAPVIDTLHPIHMAVLSDKRVVAVDPSPTGGLLVYRQSGRTPARRPLIENGKPLAATELVGLSLDHSGQGLVATDTKNNLVYTIGIPS